MARGALRGQELETQGHRHIGSFRTGPPWHTLEVLRALFDGRFRLKAGVAPSRL
jgi:hypothetical protein